MVEFLHALKEKPRTLFATHYHELTKLAAILPRVKNYHIAVKERITGRIEKMPAIEASLFPEDMELKVWDEIRDKLKEIDIANITRWKLLIFSNS